MILNTERLTLRPVAMDDAAQFHGLMRDAEVMAFWDSIEIADVDVAANLLAQRLDEMDEGQALYWAMERAGDGLFLGCCDISDIDWPHRRAEVGFVLARRFWGDGYGVEAMHAVINHAAQALRLRRLSARTHFGNLRSVALLERLGFRKEGVLRGYVEHDGQRRDCLMYGLLL